MLNTVQHRHVAIARLSHPTNLGRTMQDLRFIIIVIAPSRAVRILSFYRFEIETFRKGQKQHWRRLELLLLYLQTWILGKG